jgi:hypothetical protein
MTVLAELPAMFAATREGLHRLACFVIAPARKVRDGRIGLRSTGDGFGTPPFENGTRIEVRGRELVVGHRSAPITTLRDAAAIVDVVLSGDPGVGADLPAFEPDADLAVDDAASRALGAWFAFAEAAIERIDRAGATVSDAQLWPEHFDLAATVQLPRGSQVNVGFSPGDTHCDEPYVYVGPHDLMGLGFDDFWNAPFGALRSYSMLADAGDPAGAVDAFIVDGLDRAGRRHRT